MRKLLWIGLLLALSGCQNLVGPRERRLNPVPIDDPFLTLEQKKQLARDRLALPEQDPTFAPPTNAGLPEPFGRRR